MPDWTMDIQGPNGGANIVTGIAYRSFRVSWTVDGPGAAEIDLTSLQISTNWVPALHRVIIKLDGTPMYAGYITQLSREGAPPTQAATYRVYSLGLAHILDWRLVRHAYVMMGERAADIVESLLDEAQLQYNGDMGFTMGTVTGDTVFRHRSYCFGVVIGDAIRELAAVGRGFDWEVDASGNLNIWNNTRGVASGKTLTEEMVQEWAVDFDASDLVTTVSAIGEPGDPYGPPHRMVRSGFAPTYGRREVAIDVSTTDHDELIDAASAELSARGGALLRVSTRWVEGYGAWDFGEVWLQDRVSVELPSHFGGTQVMRLIDISVTVEPNPVPIWFVEQTFETLIEDIDLGDPDDPDEDPEPEE